jgi:hypothetical protein
MSCFVSTAVAVGLRAYAVATWLLASVPSPAPRAARGHASTARRSESRGPVSLVVAFCTAAVVGAAPGERRQRKRLSE